MNKTPPKYQLHHEDLPDNVNLIGDVAIDTETTGLNVFRDRLCLVQMCDSKGNIHLIKYASDSKYHSPNLVALLKDQTRVKLFHYARFDVTCLRHFFKLPEITPIYCTKIASKIARTFTDSHGLKTIVHDLLSVELKKEQQCSYWAAEELSFEQLKYAINDVIYLHEMRNKLDLMLEKAGRKDLADQCFVALNTICALECASFNPEIVFTH